MSIVLLALGLGACSQRLEFDVSTVEPAAEGVVRIDRDKNNNYEIDLDVIRLSDPIRLTPPKSTYVVWMETTQNGTQNIGQLKSSEGMFSKALKGSLNTSTPYEPVSFFITAEETGNITSPGQVVVMRTPRVNQ